MNNLLPAVILAGGLGTRIREESEFKPKPMVNIGGRPILWHIMKHLSSYGISRFIICVGYKGDIIRDYFLNYHARNNNFTIQLGSKEELTFHSGHQESDWRVTIVETGELTRTGGRLFRIREFVRDQDFLCTYGDGLSDIDINKLRSHHEQKNSIATVTAVRAISRFGVLDMDELDNVKSFNEKPQLEGWINGGFFIFKPKIFDYLDSDLDLEKDPLQKLASENQLAAYRHHGFWQPMDTYRESKILNDMWNSGQAPWDRS